ncbi:hypothetical protein lerEdw1_006894 [Lerista edwardsae]|nr:hypothetical protein lerEdw1_006894 [Lerista edwardsae]
MAPCGCFFDPRIYRIEWATANFVQPSVYKLSSGPGPQNTYLLDSQKYLKGPIQPVPYPPYQPIANNPQFVLPFFKPEGPAANLTDHVSFISNSLHSSPFVDVPQLPNESLVSNKDHKLLTAIPGLNLKEQPSQTRNYEPLKGQLGPCHELAFEAFKDFQVEEVAFQDAANMNQDFAANPPIPNVHPEEQTPLSVPSAEITSEPDLCMNPESVLTNENQYLEEQESFSLPEKVLLEDAMKLFDCSPVNSDPEASLDYLSDGAPSRSQGEGQKDSCFSGEDSPSDIRSLNLPDELLSFDYSVPEILSAVTSLDYLYGVDAFGEEPTWESGSLTSSSQLLPNHESRLEENAKDNIMTAKKGKPKLAAIQGGNDEPEKLDTAAPEN